VGTIRKASVEVLQAERDEMEISIESDKLHQSVGGERHSRPTFLSDFILGCQDGLVNVLGILLGLTAASADVRVFFVAALAALGAESISMAAVAYTSTIAKRQVYLKEVAREMREMKDVPKVEKDEVRKIFKNWGYEGQELEEMTNRISSNPRAMLEFMMSYELAFAPIDKSEARRSFILVGSSTILGSFLPLLPYFFTGRNIVVGTEISLVLCGVVLFLIGVYEAKITVGSLWKSGLRMTAIGLIAGLAGFLIGHFIGSLPV
jgi:VIT1/CCC1 family predicted Fe2+/Mn2+ transporter